MERRRRIVLAAAFAHAAAFAQPAREKFDPRRDAEADVAAAVARAGAEGKRVIVDVGGEWCSWCLVMDRFVASNPDVRAAIDAGFVWVKVNYSPANKNERLLSKWPKVEGYPHLFVLDGSGAAWRSQRTSELENGSDYGRKSFWHSWRGAARRAKSRQPAYPLSFVLIGSTRVPAVDCCSASGIIPCEPIIGE